MLKLILITGPDGDLSLQDAPAGVSIVARDEGGYRLDIDPLEALNLQGSKRKLAALREAAASDQQAMTGTLMKVTLALSGFLEAYDWLMQSPQSGLTDDGRARIQSFFLGVVSGARSVLADARTVDVDWDEVVGGRKVDAPQGDGLERPIWATIGAELQPMVNGPEGAALVRFIQSFAEEEPDLTFADPVDWLHWIYSSLVRAAAGCRAVMETDPHRRDFATKLYQGVVSVALNVSRAMVLRGLALVPEPPPVKRDPYLVCGDCLAKDTCEAQRRCARVGTKDE